MRELYIVMCAYYGFEFAWVTCRRNEIADAKAMFAYIARKDLQQTEQAVQKFVGWKSHYSVIHACCKMEFFIQRYSKYRRQYDEISDAYEARKCLGILA